MNMFDDKIFGNPEISDESFVSSKATIIGRVIIEKNVIVCPSASLRADEGSPFRIMYGTNIQDEVILHGLLHKSVTDDEGKEYSILIGSHCTLAHGAIVHGPAKIGKHSFIGFRAIVHDAEVGRNCHIGFGAVVRGVKIADYRYVADGMVVVSQEIADILPEVPERLQEFNAEVVDYNKELCRRYKERRLLKAQAV